MAKLKVIKHPVTGIELDDINFLGISIPNAYDNPLYAEDVDVTGFSLKTYVFSQPGYYLKLALNLQLNLKMAEDEHEHEEEEDTQENPENKITEDNVFNASIAAEFIFKVISTSKRKDFDLSKLPEEFRHMAASVSYSTLRGMLYTRAAGTLLESFILPITTTNEILQPAHSADELDSTSDEK